MADKVLIKKDEKFTPKHTKKNLQTSKATR